jgi:putative ABC transport system ATP-binding protein
MRKLTEYCEILILNLKNQSQKTMSDIIASVKGAGKVYKSGDTEIVALRPTHLDLKKGELLLIIGPSGSGKTTLLSLLGCVIYPTQGEVEIGGVKTTALNENQLAALRLREIGFVFQQFNLIAPLNAAENIAMPLQLMKMSGGEIKKRVDSALELVRMTDRRSNLPKQLSGGQQQRVAIARALVTQPSLILCDEPTAALDGASVDIVMNELRALAESGKSVAVVTHDMRLRQFAHKIVYVDNGNVTSMPPEDGGH